MLENIIDNIKGLFKPSEFEPEKRQFLADGLNYVFKFTTGGLIISALFNSTSCSKKNNSSSESLPSESVEIDYIDEVLETAQQQIKQGHYPEAIKILESYQSDKKQNLAARHALMAEAYFGQFKQEVSQNGKLPNSRFRERNMFLDRIEELNQQIKQNLTVAESLDLKYQEKKWEIYLAFDGQVKKETRTDSVLHVLQTFLYGFQTKNKQLILETSRFNDEVEERRPVKIYLPRLIQDPRLDHPEMRKIIQEYEQHLVDFYQQGSLDETINPDNPVFKNPNNTIIMLGQPMIIQHDDKTKIDLPVVYFKGERTIEFDFDQGSEHIELIRLPGKNYQTNIFLKPFPDQSYYKRLTKKANELVGRR